MKVFASRKSLADSAMHFNKNRMAMTFLLTISNSPQAFLIAFTSSFLPKLLYRYSVSANGSLEGFTNYSLAWAPVNTTKEPCR